MSKKEEFKDVLKYGRCPGSDTGIMTGQERKCSKKNPGHALRLCPIGTRDCNCCDDCRGTCTMMKIIRDSSKQKMEEKMREIAEKQDEEALKQIRTRR